MSELEKKEPTKKSTSTSKTTKKEEPKKENRSAIMREIRTSKESISVIRKKYPQFTEQQIRDIKSGKGIKS